MTQKLKQPAPQPAPQKAPQKLATNRTLQQEFWDIINGIQKEAMEIGFGQNKGKGGSTLKDSHALQHFARERFVKNKIHIDIVPIDVKADPFGSTLLIHGNYQLLWIMDGEIVYESKSYGAFASDNAAHALHGSVTTARTNALFGILQASAKSEEDMENQYQQEKNIQSQRKPIETYDY